MVVQPLCGQIANIWGRRYPMILSVVILITGSAICGWATNGAMLIAGRAVQGVGGGAMNMLVELIICDLVPLRERAKFLGVILGTFAIGTAIGPFLGGVIAQSKAWRVSSSTTNPDKKCQFSRVLVDILAQSASWRCRTRSSRAFPTSTIHQRVHNF